MNDDNINSVSIGLLRKSGGELPKLFEAVRVAQALGHRVTIELYDSPIEAPEGEEREYDKTRRLGDSAVIEFFAETELET